MDQLPEEEKPGIPAWVVTFADLMSLLMCFFVLLLSFSEIDAQKFKQIAGELSKAFGVQREVPALEIPMGTSPVFDKFSPGKPEPTLLDQVRQTTAETDPQLDTLRGQVESEIDQAMEKEMQENLDAIAMVLAEAIQDGRIQLEQRDRRIVIRVEERGSFPSGSAQVTYEFEGLLLRMAEVFENLPGKLTIEGHTDNLPIRSDRFQSNWDLSAVRAASVANVLLANPDLEADRLAVKGLAATEPRASNDTPEGRALNRRVEIILDLSGPMAEQEARLRDLILSEEANMRPEIIAAPPVPGNTEAPEEPEEPGETGDLAW
ncbi:MAG: flagellar motor protein MotB [Marinobacter sp.]|uniref:flagellar motor protein MotB n=1 Tax=Marinobacter sp. TaxID=50741 RepID=UPI00299E2DB9|nr:flagellar motor protein MotB [Marinobacter sp.]MDX1635074.1 flagellar motor protein MotB [Marinobacter sp.]